MIKKLVFSGVQPTGNLHLGNYLGILKNLFHYKRNGMHLLCCRFMQLLFQDPNHLHNNVLETTASFLQLV